MTAVRHCTPSSASASSPLGTSLTGSLATDPALAAEGPQAYLISQPMNHHHHQIHEGESLRSAAKLRLVAKGEQWTDMRAAIFDALAAFDKPASAYDIAEAVSKAQGRR